jgi:EPS-associated MarR family transcriptional regulator
MNNQTKDFQILEALDSQEITSQRQLSEKAGISLGQVNYVLKNLLEKGLIKIGNFRKNPNKIGYVYLLTPKGIEAKSSLAADFVVSRLREYENLRQKIKEKLADVESRGHSRIVFVGPDIVKEFINTIIKENRLDLIMAGYCDNRQGLKAVDPESFDIALIFDGNTKGVRQIRKSTGISKEKVLSFW